MTEWSVYEVSCAACGQVKWTVDVVPADREESIREQERFSPCLRCHSTEVSLKFLGNAKRGPVFGDDEVPF